MLTFANILIFMIQILCSYLLYFIIFCCYITVLILSCPHCDQLCDDIKHYDYAIREISIEANSTCSSLKTLLHHAFPLIICSCLKRKVVSEVFRGTSTWNVLQLHQTSKGNQLQYKCGVKVIIIQT